jgi:hypothetical protein
MFSEVARFEFRYQIKSPLFAAAAALLFLAAFVDMSVAKIVGTHGGNVLFNSPHAIIVSHLLTSLVFFFAAAAFVSNVVVRDDQTGFGPILRSTDIGTANYLFGRFLGAFAVGALIMAATTAGAWLGTLMPFADQQMLGPNRLAAFTYGYGFFALPNALIISAILFAFATITRSTAGTFTGVVSLLVLYLFSQRIMEGQPQLLTFRVLVDPFGISAYMAASRYFTVAELNAGAVPVTRLMVLSRLLWIGISFALLALTYRRFRFSDRAIPRRRLRKLRQQEMIQASFSAADQSSRPLAKPTFDRATAVAQFAACAAMEARYIFKSPVFLILLLIAFAFMLPSLLTASDIFGVSLYPLTAVTVPVIKESFDVLLIAIAAFYAGELVWRERERNINEIIDATPLPAWAFMLPKMLGLATVLCTTLLVGMGVGIGVQLLDGAVNLAPGQYLLWYLLPGAFDSVLIAALAVFVQAVSPSKYVGWGGMFLYIILLTFGPSMGLEYPLFLYGSVPSVPLSDMTGTGNFGRTAWWFRLFWAAAAVLFLVAVHLLWPRGTDPTLKRRLRQMRAGWIGGTRMVTFAATALVVLSGSWIIYNTLFLNQFRTSADEQRYLADYEKRFFRYARLPQPVVRHVELNIALYPEEIRAEVWGRYVFENATDAPIERVHVRLMNEDLALLNINFPAASLELDDEGFGYRIYRLNAPMQPGDLRSFTFRTRRQQVGFRASGTETGIAPNGTDLDSLELTPRIGMSDAGLIEDPAVRRRYGLPEQRPFPRLDDVAATKIPPGDLNWTTADITISTSADQVPVAPGKKLSERVANGRRIARFVSDTPIKNFFLVQSARYAVRSETHAAVDYAIYFHPGHHWNVDRMMRAMQASIEYYRHAFGPYQFDQARIVETPSYRSGAQAFANTVPISEDAAFVMDLRDPNVIDMATMITAHELAHQWWGHQVLGARMQGAGLLHETLAQYSALMVMKKLTGEGNIRRLLRFQLDRYLSGRRTEVLAEEPLVSVELSQKHIAYGKGALAMYLLQHRIGEEALNRALRRFVERYRFTVAPYPRSLDLIGLLREEAKTPADQALITDLFERITVYDLRVEHPTATKRRDGRWDVTVPVEADKAYADGTGKEQPTVLDEPIDVGLFTSDPGSDAFEQSKVLILGPRPIHSGRQVLHFVTDQRPTHAGIDPYHLYIDRNSSDNVAAVAD